MTRYFKLMVPLLLSASLMLGSCAESKTDTKEETEISKMDSLSNAVKDSTKKLEEQTEKVEDALDKLDKEFEKEN